MVEKGWKTEIKPQIATKVLVVFSFSLLFAACAEGEKDEQDFITSGSKFDFYIGSYRSDILQVADENNFEDVSTLANVSNREKVRLAMKSEH